MTKPTKFLIHINFITNFCSLKMALFTNQNYEEVLEWFDHHIYKCFTLFYWLIVIFGSFWNLMIESNDDIKKICPISGIWNDLLFQSIISAYGFCYIVFLKRNDCDQVLLTMFDTFVYYMDIVNICMCCIALIYNGVSLANTCNDKISHTGLYQMASMNIIPCLFFLAFSSLMVLPKRMVIEKIRSVFVPSAIGGMKSSGHQSSYGYQVVGGYSSINQIHA